jgi:dTDP-4-amino-4,6-dideoxy-D-galactose acyltransferase
MIQKLNWDSDFFRLNIGKVIINNNDSFDVDSFRIEAKKDKYDLVYIFKYGNKLNEQCINYGDIELIDIMLSMSKILDKKISTNVDFDFRNTLSNQELKECVEIAEQAAKASRFYKDPLIGYENAKMLYRKWLDNALNKIYADGVLLYKIDNKVRGLHIIKTDSINKIGYCSLIAVDEEMKSIGIGRKLWDSAFSFWNTKHEINKCIVPFSLENIDSFNFHLKIGFNKVEETKFIYHFHGKLIL